MGVGISGWKLAQAVSRLGHLGVVSGTALDQVLVRRLQDGDPGGHMRRALDCFPVPEIAKRIWNTYYIPGGKAATESYCKLPLHTIEGVPELNELCVVANFVEVHLAREGHTNPVGINYLEKIQLPLLPSIYGAMLAGVDYILMGAGIPVKVPGVLDRLVHHETVTYPINVAGAQDGDNNLMTFSPLASIPGAEIAAGDLKRPKFLAIIASNVLAVTLLKKSNGSVDGFIIEGPTAGGHNAPPRGKLALNDIGEPLYGERDRVDLAKMRELGVPFWLAGGFGAVGRLQYALSEGAAGIQVGTAFALCNESGLRQDYKESLLKQAQSNSVRIFTDPLASPTGFPFKVARMEGTASETDVYTTRPRVCDLGYLREAYRTADGRVDYRCAGEPVTTYTAKGGDAEASDGRKCLCNGLMANIGMAQVRAGGKHVEPGLITAGDGLARIAELIPPGQSSYSAADVIDALVR
jgi:nitronate monooxygenase